MKSFIQFNRDEERDREKEEVLKRDEGTDPSQTAAKQDVANAKRQELVAKRRVLAAKQSQLLAKQRKVQRDIATAGGQQ
jgi:hypothetical protein